MYGQVNFDFHLFNACKRTIFEDFVKLLTNDETSEFYLMNNGEMYVKMVDVDIL